LRGTNSSEKLSTNEVFAVIRMAVLFLFVSALALTAQSQQGLDAVFSEASIRLKSSDWEEREQGFSDMLRGRAGPQIMSSEQVTAAVKATELWTPEQKARVVAELGALLEREARMVNSPGFPGSEGHSEYYANLIQAVSMFRDKSGIPGLLLAVNTGGMAFGALAGLGDDALNGALKILPTADAETLWSLLHVFTQMTDPSNLEQFKAPDARGKLLNALALGANDSDPALRRVVAPGLARLGSPEALQILSRMAQSDPYVVTVDGKPSYPVREAAKAALQSRAGQQK
jgi:hypothetical protein